MNIYDPRSIIADQKGTINVFIFS